MFGLYCAAHVYNLSHEWPNQIMSLKPNSYFSPWIHLSSRIHLKVCFNWNWNVNLEAQSACASRTLCGLPFVLSNPFLIYSHQCGQYAFPSFQHSNWAYVTAQILPGLYVTNIRIGEAHFLSLHHTLNPAMFLFSTTVHTFMCCLTFVTHHAY